MNKPIIRKFKQHKVYSSFKDNIRGADLNNIQLISKYDKQIRFLLCVTDALLYMLGDSFKRQKGCYNTNAFTKNLDNSNRKPNEIWVDESNEFFSRSTKSW